nr:immunoglobulin light chain junction region [Macaca mulatta]MOX87484.1 immunoglobulin light chain junction region [Macaca mulatta]
CQNCDSAPLTF